MRLIDADELLDEICREQCERKFTDCDGMCEMAAVVVNAPTVDAVPVVRCKDCKHAYIAGNLCKYCDLYKDDDGFPIELYLEADWFCAGGERKEGR